MKGKKEIAIGIFVLVVLSIFFIKSISALSWLRPQQEISQANFTNITTLIYEINQSLYNQIYSVNNSLYYLIMDVNQSLSSEITNNYNILNNNTNNVNSSLTSIISAVNLSLYNYIYNVNQTLSNLSEIKVYYEYLNITTLSGSGNATSHPIDFQITRITITPQTANTKYRFFAYEKNSGAIIDTDRKLHNGIWDIYKSHSINNDNAQLNITSANPDDNFTIKLTYLDNFG